VLSAQASTVKRGYVGFQAMQSKVVEGIVAKSQIDLSRSQALRLLQLVFVHHSTSLT
jgi:hypothetical protein